MYGEINTSVTICGKPLAIDATYSIKDGEVTIYKVRDNGGRKIDLSKRERKKVEDEIISAL